jgi:hypothetical protein
MAAFTFYAAATFHPERGTRMGLLHQFFSLEELKALDLKGIEILKATIQNEIRTSPTIQTALRGSVRQVYNQLTSGPGSSTPKP